VSIRTVETHRSHIHQKLNVRNRAELVRRAKEAELLDGDNPVRDLPQHRSVASADARPGAGSQDGRMMRTRAEMCAVSTGPPHVVLVVAHHSMRDLIVELLHRDHRRWVVSAIDSVSDLDDTASSHPDLVIVDTADFAAVRRQLPATFAPARVVVIGPEPDPAYHKAALQCGAGAWLSRDRVAEELCDALRSTLARANGSSRAPVEQSPTPE